MIWNNSLQATCQHHFSICPLLHKCCEMQKCNDLKVITSSLGLNFVETITVWHMDDVALVLQGVRSTLAPMKKSVSQSWNQRALKQYIAPSEFIPTYLKMAPWLLFILFYLHFTAKKQTQSPTEPCQWGKSVQQSAGLLVPLNGSMTVVIILSWYSN